jgi:ornithine cyclodeaminase/alanine dehydrogenase-like protein (mu-crystallin family)
VTGEALPPGGLLIPLDLVNSWQDNVLPAADRVAADNPEHFAVQVQGKRAKAFPALKPAVTIQDIVAGKSPRASVSERTLIAVCGIASTDVMVGWEIYRRANAANIGLEFNMLG